MAPEYLRSGALAALTVAALLLGACSSKPAPNSAGRGDHHTPEAMPGMSMPSTATSQPPGSAGRTTAPGAALPGMPPLLDSHDVYAADRPGALADTVRNDPVRVYVPNLGSDTVSVIDPATYKVIQTVKVGKAPQHVVPAWDLRTLWVNNNDGNTLTPIDPATGTFGTPVPVENPYNLYFTPDGRFAMVMAELLHRIDFRDPHTMAIVRSVPVNCSGVNHADFSADGRYFIATCEFSGDLIKVDVQRQEVVGQLHLPRDGAMPQDVKITPDGRTWYVADMHTSGVWILDGDAFTVRVFLPTGAGAHGLYVSRDSKRLYIANRGEGSVSVLDFATGTLVTKWQIPGGGSPDMGGVSADGKVLWLSGRYDSEVYAISTDDGHLLARIKVGTQPHGLCFWPQPGRYSLGHTGILR
ncbi:SMP-30/gluconolactonase/LRE family protein [Dactylosporangium sp. CA-139066]|uniref:YVTN family beta-propeller repeat protein n=1 Tax=Dactylosporangium sp. CA-139066 TaxID=3239930 RepID=UPI003D916054